MASAIIEMARSVMHFEKWYFSPSPLAHAAASLGGRLLVRALGTGPHVVVVPVRRLCLRSRARSSDVTEVGLPRGNAAPTTARPTTQTGMRMSGRPSLTVALFGPRALRVGY